MKRFPLYFNILVISFMVCNTWAYTPEDCIRCHGEGSMESTRHVSVKEFRASVHAREITCTDCHVGVKDKGHSSIKGSGAVDCAQCHEQENRHGLGAESELRPRCYSCHTRHGILKKENVISSVHARQLIKSCKGCHPVECGETDYLSWLPSMQIASHNKQDFGQAYEKGHCLGCHQGKAAHGEEGPINDQGCNRCHLSQRGRATLWGFIHPRADFEKQPAVFASAILYQFFIVVLLWGGFRSYIQKLSRKRKGKATRR